MLSAAAACGWSRVERRRRTRKGWRENDREGITQCWDVVALIPKTGWEGLSLAAQMEAERGIQMAGVSDCHHLGDDVL